MNTKDIEKSMISVYKLLGDLKTREVDRVYKSYVLYACLKLQQQVYKAILKRGYFLKTLDFNVVQPTFEDIVNNQEYIYSEVKYICTEHLQKEREGFLCKK